MGDDVVTLVLPRERDFHPVARLVLSGLAARLGLTYESLDDLELALAELLEHEDREDDLVVRFAVEQHTISTEVGPFESGPLRDEFDRDDHGGVGLRRLLETVVDGVELEDGSNGTIVRLLKHAEPLPPQS